MSLGREIPRPNHVQDAAKASVPLVNDARVVAATNLVDLRGRVAEDKDVFRPDAVANFNRGAVFGAHRQGTV